MIHFAHPSPVLYVLAARSVANNTSYVPVNLFLKRENLAPARDYYRGMLFTLCGNDIRMFC